MKAKDIDHNYCELWFKTKEQLQMDYDHVLDMAMGYASGEPSNETMPKELADEYREELDRYEFMKKYLEYCEEKYLPKEGDK